MEKLMQQSGHTASIHQIQILAKLDGGWKDFFVENFKFAFGWGKRERLNYSDDATFAKMNKFNFFHKTRTDFGHFYKILWVVKFNITRYNNDISSTKAITK